MASLKVLHPVMSSVARQQMSDVFMAILSIQVLNLTGKNQF
jgi:hypothetical protein